VDDEPLGTDAQLAGAAEAGPHAPSTARRRLASAATYIVFLPPSSRETPTSRRAADWATLRPVAVDPVKLT
jgi:hypothetical protein